MSRRTMLTALILAFVALVPSQAGPVKQAIENPVKLMALRSSFPAVNMNLIIDTPAAGRCEIAWGNVRIFENGIEQVPTVECIPGSTTSAAVDMIVVFDDTGSMYGQIDAMKAGATAFAEDMANYGVDPQFALVSFADIPEVDQGLTPDVGLFQEAVDRLEASGGAGYAEADLEAMATGLLLSGRPRATKVFLLITDAVTHYRGDGDPEATSHYTMPEVVAACVAADSPVYVVSPGDTSTTGMVYPIPYPYPDPWEPGTTIPADEDNVRVLAGPTGGKWYNMETVDFAVMLDDVAAGLVTRYVMSYSTRNTRSDGRDRLVEIRVTDPDPEVGTNSAIGHYVAPFIRDPDFRASAYASYGGPGCTTADPHVNIKGTCDPKVVALLLNGSTAGVTFSGGSEIWAYEGLLDPGANVIEVVTLDVYGNAYGPATTTFFYDTTENLTLISMSAADETLNLYDTIRVEGELGVPGGTPELLMGRIVRVRYERLGFEPVDQYTVTDETGRFIDSYRAEGLGVWTVRAKFDGDAELRQSGWSSPEAVVTVVRGSDVDLSGKVDSIDVQLVINAALGMDISPMSADGNCDGQTDATDVQMAVNAALAA